MIRNFRATCQESIFLIEKRTLELVHMSFNKATSMDRKW